MLVLSRRVNQSIKINDNITIVVCRMDHNRVHIGIEAPREVRIVRTELLPPENVTERKAV